MTITRLDVREASDFMLTSLAGLPAEHVKLEASLGRVLAVDVVSPVSLPPHDNASMDGFAVHSADIAQPSREAPVRLPVTRVLAAGDGASAVLERGTAMRIMTGAWIPAGADSVIRVEDTESSADSVTILDARDTGRNIRAMGEDVEAGSVVMRAGTQVTAAHLGVLASVGCATPSVFRRPRVAILATGDELVTLEHFDTVLAGNRIVSSNSYALAAAVHAAGGEPVMLGIAPDNPEQLAECLRKAEGCDVVLTSGGVSVGDFDYTRTVVTALGGELSLWRVKMRPGAPLAYGTLFGTPWLGLPGNPVSALVTFELFGRPLIRTLGGFSRPHRRTLPVLTGSDITLGAPLTHFLRVRLDFATDGLPVASLTGAQSSGMLTSMSAADALLVVPPDPLVVRAGTTLRALVLDTDLGGGTRLLT